MTDNYRFVPLNSIENRLGNALGLALGMLYKPSTVDNRTIAQIETAFKEWCDAVVDEGRLHD